ncbi:MAG: hypothetical protein EBZ49_05775, partial [Proteobacteria bacterium]|nr:hypothetical protein [Pseudomonadota bacterium]
GVTPEEPKLVQEFKAIYKTCYDLIKEISRNLEGFNSRSKDSDYRLFRLDELDKFNPSVADFDKVTQQAESSASALELKEGLSQLLSALENEESSVNSVLWGVAKGLSRLEEKASGPALTELHGRAETLARGIDELNYEISRLLSSVDVDEESIEEAQKRVFDYQELFRKHGVKDIGALLSEYERLKTECLSQEEATIKFKADLDKAFQLSKQVRSAAETLSKHRMKAGERIKKTVEKELSELAMAGAKFDICWEDCDGLKAGLDFASFKSSQLDSLSRSIDETWTGMGTEGFERAEFMLASNPGEPVLPLLKVASGGELSRIMLALKKALVADADTCVLVFDEIDTGISGRIADVVGKKMYELSRDFQVLCISHLPQVAVYADTHFLVKKEAKGVRTESRIIPLTSEESASEIARLLSGSEVSKSSLANAKNLIQKAKSHETKQRRGLNY